LASTTPGGRISCRRSWLGWSCATNSSKLAYFMIYINIHIHTYTHYITLVIGVLVPCITLKCHKCGQINQCLCWKKRRCKLRRAPCCTFELTNFTWDRQQIRLSAGNMCILICWMYIYICIILYIYIHDMFLWKKKTYM
jgi:hypothetical protein